MRERITIFLLVPVFIGLTVSLGVAEELLQAFSWKVLKDTGGLYAGTYIPPDTLPETPFGCLKVSNPSNASMRTTVLAVDDPQVSENRYALKGRVKHQGVAGKGYLEMLNYFSGSPYFTKTLGSSGPMKCLTGDSDWRDVVLPFSTGEKAQSPDKIVLNVVLPGNGTVYLSNLKLFQYAPGENPLAGSFSGGWWSDRVAGYVGGVSGSLIGLMGAAVGFLVGFGRCQRIAKALINLILVIGIVCVILGVVAVIQSQPYAVYYPLLLVGGICVVIPLVIKKPVQQAYQRKEMRKMASMDT